MIAAGEVVERPMGVVKELVENALDAGADRITVTAEDGGISKLSVSDNGCGMDAKDAVNAFLRHATSKITSSRDLWDISTLGFRGEALPSIASVSRLTLLTSDGNDSTRVIIEYGKTVSAGPWPGDNGTEVTVENLFARTPARLKHLRSAAYENSLIQDLIMKFALSHPEVSFTFLSSGKTAFRSAGNGSLQEVIFQCWGREAAEQSIEVSFSDYDYKVTGCLIKPSVTRSSRNFMHIFMNGRMIRTYRLYQAVMDGYEDFIVKGRKPLCVLNITTDPHLIDVNVHPSKWEIRISKENQLEYLIRDHVKEALAGTMLAPNIHPSSKKEVFYEQIPLDTNTSFMRPFIASPPQKEEEKEEKKEEKKEERKTESGGKEEAASLAVALPGKKKSEPPEVKEAKGFDAQPLKQKLPEMQVLGQLHEKFILCACDEGLAVIDQHAAQERVHFEQYCRVLNQDPVMMDLLVPISLKAGDDLLKRVEELNEAVSDLHVCFEPFGGDILIVRSVPSWMKDLEEEEFLQDVLDNFRNERKSVYQRMERKKIATLACHHSIRFNRALTMQEMRAVVDQLNDCDNPYHCPHGRPTFVILSEKELAREFLR